MRRRMDRLQRIERLQQRLVSPVPSKRCGLVCKPSKVSAAGVASAPVNVLHRSVQVTTAPSASEPVAARRSPEAICCGRSGYGEPFQDTSLENNTMPLYARKYWKYIIYYRFVSNATMGSMSCSNNIEKCTWEYPNIVNLSCVPHPHLTKKEILSTSSW